jgi:hypothetical protein
MKIVRVETLISNGAFATSQEWQTLRASIHKAIESVEWPEGSGSFTIYPESGKKTGQGNGVVPIKKGLINRLRTEGWAFEQVLDVTLEKSPGGLDASIRLPSGTVGVEWETGNVSSSHRAINKMATYLLKGGLVAGILVLPTRKLARYLTDRIGNFPELIPYFDLWRSIPVAEGVLEIVAIEHDATSLNVPRIPKGTDGRALV